MADQETESREASEPREAVVTPPESLLTAERVIDVVLGAAALAVDGALRTARQVREDAPAVAAALEEKGRPLREQLLQKIGGLTDRPAAPATEAPTTGDSPPRTGSATSTTSANDEISVLERRVRELEQQIASEGTAGETAHTPAEAATFVPGDVPPFALADSPYAVSETDEEVAREAHEAPGAAKAESGETTI